MNLKLSLIIEFKMKENKQYKKGMFFLKRDVFFLYGFRPKKGGFEIKGCP